MLIIFIMSSMSLYPKTIKFIQICQASRSYSQKNRFLKVIDDRMRGEMWKNFSFYGRSQK